MGLFFAPVAHLRHFFYFLHQDCLHLVPNSFYQGESQTLICGSHILLKKNLLQTSGLIHLLFIYGFQISLVQNISKRLFGEQYLARNIFSFLAVFGILAITAFHPASLRAASALFLRELSSQKKFFWSPLQIAIFSGFLTIGFEPRLHESYALLIGWIAAIGFCFFLQLNWLLKTLLVPLIIFPALSGLTLAHPILSFVFAILARSSLLLVFIFSIGACFVSQLTSIVDIFWQKSFWFAEKSIEIFLPIQTRTHFSLVQFWVYLLLLMSLFLFLENKKLREN